MSDDRAEAIRLIRSDPWRAHRLLFRHRHQSDGKDIAAAEFHPELVADFWSAEPYSQILAFRGSAKSTIGEEDIALAVFNVVFHNILIIGASEARAAERLASVAYELANNEDAIQIYGHQRTAERPWTQTKLVTARNVCVQAMGRDQDIRGIKFLDYRPDFVFVDDFEDKDSVQTPEGRLKTLRWFIAELLPACAPNRKVRVRATPMDAESVPMRLQRESGWPTKIFPIEHPDPETGARRASWPAAYPLSWIDRERRQYERLGEIAVWEREYMCQAVADSDSKFRREQIRVEPRVRTWQAVYAMIDPARSVGRNAATTGWAVWSWLANRLIVWGAGAGLMLPDEIIRLGFEIVERFDPVWLGIEQDGLEQWLMQPIRSEQLRRGGDYVPIRGVRAPRSKLDFIGGLQPYFANREVELAQELPELVEQLLNFPRGRIDIPNALAYALQMRPGLPIYERFVPEQIVDEPEYDRARPLFLAANATGAMTTAALLQARDGRLVILADWVKEGVPGEAVAAIAGEAAMLSDAMRQRLVRVSPSNWSEMLKQAVPDRYVTQKSPLLWCLPPHHLDRWNNVGLRQAVRQVPAETRTGGRESDGQLHLADLLGRLVRGVPAVEIARTARWTLRALAGGYTRAMIKGRLQEHAEEGAYRLLMEGIESFCGPVRAGLAEREEDEDNATNYAYDRDGRAYKSAMPARRER